MNTRRQLGFAAVGFRESRENFTKQHDVRDTFDGVSLPYLAQNARVNAAAAATLALAPPPPSVVNERGQPTITRAPSGYDANLTWAASPGAVAHRVFWREAWGPDWQHELTVGNVTHLFLAYADRCDASDLVAAAHRAGAGHRLAPRVSVTDRRRLPELLRECDADIVFLDSQHAVGRQWLGFRMSSFVDQLPCPAVCVDGDRKDIRWRITSNPTAAAAAHRPDVHEWVVRPTAETAIDVLVRLEPIAGAS